MFTNLFFILLALAATAYADAGYNYQPPRPAVNQPFRPSLQLGSNAVPVIAPPNFSQYLPPANIAPTPSPQYLQPQFSSPPQFIRPPTQNIPPFQQPPVYSQAGQGVPAPQYAEPQQRQTIVSSNIYIHSAPEETEEIFPEQGGADAGPIRKNYRILFVKAPTHNIRFNINSFKQAQAPHEERTVVYVLSKSPDIVGLQNQLSLLQTEPKTIKPEVYFIKYKTPAEANRVQQEIQAQYDALGGSTSISDEGFAPISSVIGGAPINGGSNFVQSASNTPQNFIQPPLQGNQGSDFSISNVGVAAPNLRYLPAKKK